MTTQLPANRKALLSIATSFAVAMSMIAFSADSASARNSSKRPAKHRDLGHRHGATPDDETFRYVFELKGSSKRAVADLSRTLNGNGIDVAGINLKRRQVEVIVTQEQIQLIEKKLRLKGTIIEKLSEAELDPRYLNPKSLEEKMRALVARYPKLAQLHEVGQSNQGRPILALELTAPTGAENKPGILVDGMHHAREVMTPEIALDVAETLLGSATGRENLRRFRSTAQNILEQASVWVIPMLNPDGNNIVWTGNNWWRKNAHADGSKIFGVDLNRNYGFQWGACNGSSGSKSSDTYRGASPGSEPETRAISNLADQIRPIGYLSYHSYSELVLAPYGCQGQLTGEQKLLDVLGRRIAESLPTDSGRDHYTYGTSWQVLYAVDGSSLDYMFSQFGAPAYVLEVNQEFQPSYELRDPTVKKHRVAWMQFMNDLLDNLLTIRVIGFHGDMKDIKIEFAEIDHKYKERPFATDDRGTFYKTLAPGEYHIRLTAPDGRKHEQTITHGDGPQILEIKL